MNGTEKQIAWAREIIAAVEPHIEALLAARLDDLLAEVPDFLLDEMRTHVEAGEQTVREQVAAFIARHTEAAYWIDQYQRRAVGSYTGEWITESIAKRIIEEATR